MKKRADYTSQVMNCLNGFKEVVKRNPGKRLSITTYAKNKGLSSHHIKAFFQLGLLVSESRGYYKITYKEITKERAIEIEKQASVNQKQHWEKYYGNKDTADISTYNVDNKTDSEVKPKRVRTKKEIIAQPIKKTFSMLWGLIKFDY